MADKSGYGRTLNLPRTEFPMKADLPKREPVILEYWGQIKLYERLRAARKSARRFMFHDGPPYANGPSHLGHVVNNVLKDAVIRYKFSRGFDIPYVPGWDCHGQPIEHQYLKTTGLDVKDIDPLELRRACREYAMKWMKIQREERKRLGVLADWDHPYLTMDKILVAAEIESVGKLIRDGYIFRGKKPVIWCATCETALAENAVEYGPHLAPSIYVRFRIKRWPASLAAIADKVKKPAYAVIWTTTPWTLPANVAVAFNPGLKYDVIDAGDEVLVVAHDLAAGVLDLCGLKSSGTVATVEGKEFEGLECEGPLVKRASQGILADHVTLEAGSGIVHTAPGHGEEDYVSGVEYRLPILAPVDTRGRFTSEYPEFEGRQVFEANAELVQVLKEKGLLLHESVIEHTYPFCWRCKNPIIFRATEQWFISLEHKQLKKRSVEAVRKVTWYPAAARDRMADIVDQRPDWCISRQRSWGVPIPVFYCTACGSILATEESLGAVRDWVKSEGPDVWWAKEAEALLPANTRCVGCGGRKFRKETDTLDVWFDSGVTHTSVLRTNPELSAPADLYMEATDQFRGWFQSSLLTSVALYGEPPYREVFAHGFVLDPHGQKMSKSRGTGIDLKEAVELWGADVARLWGLLENYWEDISVSEETIARVGDAYRKFRNTLRFLLGNLSDEGAGREVAENDYREVDKWMRWRCATLIEEVTRDLDAYEFYHGGQRLLRFCTVDLSAFYMDLLKDRLYASRADDGVRRAAQKVLGEIFGALVRMLGPFIPFTAEEAWGRAPAWLTEGISSVHLAGWPAPKAVPDAGLYAGRWSQFMRVREAAMKQIEAARQKGEIASQLESRVTLAASGELKEFLLSLERDLSELLVVSQVQVTDFNAGVQAHLETPEGRLAVFPSKAQGTKCPRCWLVRPDVKARTGGHELCERCARAVEGF